MVTRYLIRHSEYHDSVTLMEIARTLTELPGIHDAAVVMGTEANRALLRDAGMFAPAIEAASPNDLIVAVLAADCDGGDRALEIAEEQLARRPESEQKGSAFQPRTLRVAKRTNPDANLAVISVAGQFAAAEAWDALNAGLHVLLFSDNVSLADEVALKRFAGEHGLLMMGPDCGTALLNGVALGFANQVPTGPVGIVSAAGTGLQEVSSLLAKLGVGVSQGIGTGGRDLSKAVAGLTMLQGIRALQADPATRVLLLISKPPDPSVAARVLAQVTAGDKVAVVCFLGGDPAAVAAAGAIPARTLQEAAYLAAAEVEGQQAPSAGETIERERADLRMQAAGLKTELAADQVYLRGLYSGGTLAAEARVILAEEFSLPLQEPDRVAGGSDACRGHCLIDLGADEYTIGRLHPMIDNDLRLRRLLQEADDPSVAVVLLDVVLGYGSHPDPAAELGPAIRQARQQARDDARELVVLVSVTGTDADPQNLSRQVTLLRQSGAVVASCNAAAARLAGYIVR